MLDTVKINHVQHISFTQSRLTDAVSVILSELLSYEHPSKRGVLFCGQKASRSLDYAVTGMFNTFYPNVFILFSIAFTPTIVFVDARLCNLATLVLETIGFTVTTPSLTPITFPRAIVSVILTPDKLFVFLTISTFALDGIVTTKLSPTFGVLLISPILITNLSLEAETIFACNFFLFSIIFYINVQTPTNEPACSGSRI